MHLHFASSFGFDNVYPRFAQERGKVVSGQLYVGLKGFLETLELHLGHVHIDIHDALRVSQYKKAVQRAVQEDDSLYITDSFSTDAWGSARQLLLWRDELQLGLWDFKCDDPTQKRLYTLSIVESHIDELAYGVNDRWRNIIEVIAERNTIPIKELTLYESQSHIHPFFIHLSQMLSDKGVAIHWHEHNYEIREDDLGSFGRKLSNSNLEKVEAHGDGSLIVIEADNEQLIADALAIQLDKTDDETLLLLPDRGEVLERTLVQSGFPAIGYMSSQSDTALQQLITLITVFLWKPIHPEKITQFLTLPNAPISKELRLRLAEAYANKQGINNDEWEKAIDRYCQRYKHDKASVVSQIDHWFGREKYEYSSGVPKNDLIKLYADLAAWSRAIAQRQTDDDVKKMAYLKLNQDIRNLIVLIKTEAEDETPIQELELQKWISALEGDTMSRSNPSEIGAMPHISHPANITTPTKRTIWWNFLDQGNPLGNNSRWSSAELDILSSCYIHSPERQLELWYAQLCHAVQMTSEQLILCIPKKSKGEEKDVCPLYADLLACFDSILPIVTTIDLSTGKISMNGLTTTLQEYEAKGLPKRQVSWAINAEHKLARREQESYSSLHKLFYYPYSYYLNYLLKIRPIELPDIRVTPLLLGNLAHNTAELLWQNQELFSADDYTLKQIIEDAITQILKSEGAVFEMDKNTISRKEYIATVKKSMYHLISEIKKNGWSFLEAEQKHEVRNHIGVNGYIDLVLQRGDEIAIVDLKWGGANKRRKELRDHAELQLIVYDQLLKPMGKKVYLHYYIISKSTFIGRTDQAFASTEVFKIDDDLHGHRHFIWSKMIKTYEARWSQLSNGVIEVGDGLPVGDFEHLEPLYTDDPFHLSMPTSAGTKDEDRYSVYNNIIGRL